MGLSKITRLAQLTERFPNGAPDADDLQKMLSAAKRADETAERVEQERARLSGELARTQDEIRRVQSKLDNAEFVAKAPERVVNAEREKLEKYRAVAANLQAALEQLG